MFYFMPYKVLLYIIQIVSCHSRMFLHALRLMLPTQEEVLDVQCEAQFNLNKGDENIASYLPNKVIVDGLERGFDELLSLSDSEVLLELMPK